MAKKRILLIDDDTLLTGLLKVSLEKTGKFEVRMENKGSNGLNAAKAFMPDLILLDVMMPDADGGEVGNQIKNDDATKGIPIIFLTAAVTKEEIGKQCSIIGGHPFIAKPVSVDELINCINKHIT